MNSNQKTGTTENAFKDPNPNPNSTNADTTHKTEKDPKPPIDRMKDVGSCLMTGMAIYTTLQPYLFLGHHSMKTEQQNEMDHLNSAQALNNSSSQNGVQAGLNGLNISDPGKSKIVTQSHSISPDSKTNNNGSIMSSACNTPSTNGQNGAIQCAVASDSTLPPYVSSNKFANDFKNATGTDLSNFIANSRTPIPSLTAAMSGNLTPAQVGQLGSALNEFNQQIERNPLSSTYYGGGQTAHKEEDGTGELMAQLVNQLNPKKAESPQNAQNEMNFKNLHNPNQTSQDPTENKTLSLFERISREYFRLNQMMEKL